MGFPSLPPEKSFDTSGFATDNLKNERNIAVS